MKSYKVLIAETSPIISAGLSHCLKNLKELTSRIIEVDSRDSLFETVTSQEIDLLVVNPTFGGLLHPNDIRKCSLNPALKIFAIEIGKINKSTVALYDDHFHVSDDMAEISLKVKNALKAVNVDEAEKDTLSIREKEIISYVVKGFTNQEIADRLYLSVHTVMTHRRNIARKLQIHSATGLTIFAIVNKIVDLSEIRL